MLIDKDLSHSGGESSKQQNKDNQDESMSLSQKGSLDFLKDSNMGLDGFASSTTAKPIQELTLSYLCENPKFGFPDKEFAGKILMEKLSLKGKEVVLPENSNQDQDKWVERDFLNLNESTSNNNRGHGNSSKREVLDELEDEEEFSRENSREKKPKLETLNLCLALPDVSLSLTAASNAVKPKPCKSTNTHTTYSNDFTTYSYSYSHPFSHNPSCSLTRNSTENFGDDQMWCGGEGTNGSVHSRFRPLGDGLVALNAPPMMQGKINTNNKDNNSLYKTTSSDNHSFFPSELPARPRGDNISGDSRRRESESLIGFECENGGRARKLSRPERILREIVSEPIPVMSQIFQELSDEILESVKEYLRSIISNSEKKDELVALQSRLERRADLTKETLSKCHKDQLETFVAIKMGLGSFVSGKIRLSTTELVEIFLLMRCRNVNCRSVLPVDDCDCKICSANKGFCSSCMCPVCLNFDCASNTCTWVGCDVCSHWCHAACGIQKNLIKPGPSLKGPSGTSEMQFHCIACGHASEMFGFVKDVFMCCAKDWGLETLKKELDCVRKIFKVSDDFKGKGLHIKADELLLKLESNMMSASEACNLIIKFFNYSEEMPEFGGWGVSSKVIPAEARLRSDVPASTQPPKYSIYNMSSSSGRHELLSNEVRQNGLKAALLGDLKIEEGLEFGKLAKRDGFESLESIVRIKEAEAQMFQSKADEARREAERFRTMIRFKSENLEQEYTQKLSKLCLQDTEERRRKKLDELKLLENSHCDYYNMKLRMQAEIAGLLERMEATKQQQWV